MYSFASVIYICQLFQAPCISIRTYNLMQRCYLVPAVNSIWRTEQLVHLRAVTTAVKLGGDGRCDSPGHSAKYGTYTLMDLDQKRVLDLQLVQVCCEI